MASRAQFNSRSPTMKRIMREAAELTSSSSPDYTATPLDDNLFEWHFTLRGPPGDDSPSDPSDDSSLSKPAGVYSRGIYHGRIVLPPTYPLRPPSFRFFTPSGRFECNREICLSISGHHEETWQPAWGLRTALVALRTFMETNAKGQLGGLDASDDVRRRLADESRGWKCPTCAQSNEEIIRSCEQASKAAEERGEERKDETIPDELKLSYKDEVGKSSTEKGGQDDASASAELAEGFIQTVAEPVPARHSAASPAQGVPQPTVAVRRVHFPPHAENAHAVRSNGGVPAWLDKVIALNIVFLAFLLFRWALSA